MAPRATGQLLERRGKRGVVYAARLHAYGRRHYVTLGRATEGWHRRRAEQELENILADARRGIWQPAERRREPDEPPAVPYFHEFACEWFEGRRLEGERKGRGLTPAGEAALRWQLELHVLPAFGVFRVDEITGEDVDRFRRAKVAEGRLNATSINKCLATPRRSSRSRSSTPHRSSSRAHAGLRARDRRRSSAARAPRRSAARHRRAG